MTCDRKKTEKIYIIKLKKGFFKKYNNMCKSKKKTIEKLIVKNEVI